ncbi:unnamed protein product [Adineta ricciae]|uniref:Cadherin domain-containing protein n=1 Tax=Adineta ricciae TaxID=249248 RepID=A0A816EF65_ADIRI|nr:unnamed protein product [Adineta ricciae]
MISSTNITFVLFFVLLYSPVVQSLQELSLDLSIKEEQPNGTLVADLTTHFPFFANDSHGYLVKFVRSCPNIYLDPHNPFFLRAFTIDREQLCPYERTCSFHCQLFLQKRDIHFIHLRFNIEDINDHPAQFRKRIYSYELDQNLPLNYHLQLEQAEDQDYLSRHTYSLNISSSSSSSHFPFRLNYDESNHLLELILVQPLSSSTRKYAFALIVDNDEGKEEDRCLIELKILSNEQKNSSPPEFDSKFYQFVISDPNQTFVGKVHVQHHEQSRETHDDKVYYRLISSSEQTNDLFKLNERSGEIYLRQKPSELSLNEMYELFVEAFYANYLSSLTTVHIAVNLTHSTSSSASTSQQQDYFIEILIPKLFHKNASNLNQIYLQENSTVPLTLLQLFISSSSISLLNVTLTSALRLDFRQYFSLKQLDSDDQQSFELILIRPFDYELIQHFHLDFVLTSHNFTHKSFEVFAENINDCRPEFDENEYRFEVQENNVFPLLLHTFHVFDRDQMDNIVYEMQMQGEFYSSSEQVDYVVYSLCVCVCLDDDAFVLNSTSGQLWIMKSLDRESRAQYSSVICAFDQVFRTCSSLVIVVQDENDNICSFNSSSLTLNVDENLPPHSLLTRLQAFDPDQGSNGTLHYEFVSPTSYLTVDPSTGSLYTSPSHVFDYELMQQYSITVKACDNIRSLPSFCCYLQVNIHLNDMDDNRPYLTYPSNTNQLFLINYSNKSMPQLKAFDDDIETKNRLISFDIVGGTLNTSLSVDRQSGQLYLVDDHNLPLYGTLVISLSSRTLVYLTLLIHDHHTDPDRFLRLQEESQSTSSLIASTLSSPLFYLIVSICIGISIMVMTPIVLMLYFCKQKSHHDSNPLMTTPSTTTLSGRSISTTATGVSAKKLCETYYSFGDSASHVPVIQV